MKRKIFIVALFVVLGYIASRLWESNYFFPSILIVFLPASLVLAFLYLWLYRRWAFKLPLLFFILGFFIILTLTRLCPSIEAPIADAFIRNVCTWGFVGMMFSFSLFLPALLILSILGFLIDRRKLK